MKTKKPKVILTRAVKITQIEQRTYKEMNYLLREILYSLKRMENNFHYIRCRVDDESYEEFINKRILPTPNTKYQVPKPKNIE